MSQQSQSFRPTKFTSAIPVRTRTLALTPQPNFEISRIPSHPASRYPSEPNPGLELKHEVLQSVRIKQIIQQLKLAPKIYCYSITVEPKIRLTTLELMTPSCLKNVRELRLISCGSNLLRHLFWHARNLNYLEVEIDEEWTLSDVQQLADFIKHQTQLEALKLVNHGCDHAIRLDQGVSFQLQSLTLESVKLAPESLLFLDKQRFLKSAKLILSSRSKVERRVLSSLLYNNNQKMESLELMIQDVEVDHSCIKRHVSIRSLIFAEKDTAKGVKLFARLLSIMPRLTTLHLTCSGIKKHDDNFFKQISCIPGLKTLHLRNVSPLALENLDVYDVRDLFYDSDIDDYPELLIEFFRKHKKIIRLELAITVNPDFCRRLVDGQTGLKELTIWNFNNFGECIASLMLQHLKVLKVPQCHFIKLSERERDKFGLFGTALKIFEEDIPIK